MHLLGGSCDLSVSPSFFGTYWGFGCIGWGRRFGDLGIGTRSLQYFLITQFKSNVKCYRRQDFRILNARNRRLMDKYVKTFVS